MRTCTSTKLLYDHIRIGYKHAEAALSAAEGILTEEELLRTRNTRRCGKFSHCCK